MNAVADLVCAQNEVDGVVTGLGFDPSRSVLHTSFWPPWPAPRQDFPLKLTHPRGALGHCRIVIPATDTQDEIVFQMLGGTHDVAQVSFDAPCTPLEGGFRQDEPVTVPDGVDAPGPRQFTYTVQDSTAVLFFADIANQNCARGAILSVANRGSG